MSNYIVSDTSLGSVADAIRTKGGTSAPLEYPQGFIDAIDAIETGGGGGDTPIPDDGKTRIWISIAEETPDNRLTFYLRFTASVANNTTVDWGDGVSETLGSTTATNYSHKYSQGGDYIITMTVNTGTIAFEGTSGNSGYSIYGARDTSNYHNKSRIRRIVFGNNVTSIDDYVCHQCYGLTNVTISDSVTSIGAQAFAYCYTLAPITIPDGVISIGSQAFAYCYALASITIPDSVISIESGAFAACYGVSEYHFKPTTPPTLANTNIFYNIPSDCIIYVPYSADHSILDAYKTATNWSTYASKMQEESA